ncbi:phospholipase D-like domain-containing protein [Kordiimonas sp.]|uniref:phospholipase D-like domain-containing protein n=1 Tax=Kordiimonas sp. TaxID=1970157 RepID=UPI003A8DAC42
MTAKQTPAACDNDSAPYRFHHTVTGAWRAMLGACKEAKTSIDLEEFIMLPDEIGRRFTDTLCASAERGVRVRLLLDWWGSREMKSSSQLRRLKESGVAVSFYRPPSLKTLAPVKFFPRNHRKVLIVDKQTAFAGGVCIFDNIRDWRDSMVEFNGDVTDQLLTLFNTTWNFVNDGTPIEEKGIDFSGERPYAIIANAPHTRNTDFTKAFRRQLKNAQQRVRLCTPYFSPIGEVLDPLFDLLDRGVELELILSDYSKYAPYVVGKKLCGQLIERGAQIYYYEPSMLHLKQVIIDDSWGAIGSFNLDGLSIRQNEEVMITTGDHDFVAELQTQFEKDRAQSVPFSLEHWRNRPLSEKITGTLLKPFRHYL